MLLANSLHTECSSMYIWNHLVLQTARIQMPAPHSPQPQSLLTMSSPLILPEPPPPHDGPPPFASLKPIYSDVEAHGVLIGIESLGGNADDNNDSCPLLSVPLVFAEHLYSAEDILGLRKIATTFHQLFRPQPQVVAEAYIYKTKKHFSQSVNAVSQRYGFVISNASGNKFTCSMAKCQDAQVKLSAKRSAKVPEHKRQKWKPLIVGAPSKLLCLLLAEQSLAQKHGIEVGSVRVLKAQFFHASGCLPSCMQLVESKIRIGNYSKPL